MHGIDLGYICTDLVNFYSDDDDIMRDIVNTVPEIKSDLIDYIENNCSIKNLRKAINKNSKAIKFYNMERIEY